MPASNVPLVPRRATVMLLVAALHALVLLAWLRQPAVDGPPAREPRHVTVQLLTLQRQTSSPASPQPGDLSSSLRRIERARRPATSDARSALPPATPADALDVPPSTTPASAAEPPIDLDASMRTVAREMARGGAIPIDGQAASTPGLGEAIAATSAPDCRTAYRSLGLLGLPVLAWNALRDRCR